MSMLEYVKSLLPSFGQDRIVDDLSRLRAELHELVLPSLEQAEKTFKGHAFQSDYAKGLETTLKRRFKDHKAEDLFGILHAIFKDAPAKIEALEKLVEASFAKDVTKEALTYRKANILKFIEIVGFAIQYTTRATLRVISGEADYAGGRTAAEGSAHHGVHQADVNYLDDKYVAWLDALVLLDQPARAIEEQLASVPEVTVAEGDHDAIAASVDAKRLDPLRQNFIAPSWNPIYHIRSYIAEYEVASINKSKEEKKLVELYLYKLKAKQKNEPTAAVERQIELVQDRLKKIDFKIAKLSEI
jgi:hypothetical protein